MRARRHGSDALLRIALAATLVLAVVTLTRACHWCPRAVSVAEAWIARHFAALAWRDSRR